MEMLQEKQEEEKKKLREQMEAEAAVQRQQMENTVKARMMEVKKHRRKNTISINSGCNLKWLRENVS